ncbi:sodium:alanine symporter family protein [Vibrio sp. HA2012]|uniref:alanine/glycine:cation symporter family protein n=1 Tax=Vibrio sp. HA2012 TaxID=1971595 RepID=UPI000C2CD693|nr:sodium:alanine symporter family protein [Vibrio sp. HA2012]PJC87291.1 sodium:alanine symporter family protein [Vibrio sp. HA2012]
MDLITGVISQINGIVWGWPMLILILGIGIYLSLGLKLFPILQLGSAFKLLWDGRSSTGEGEIPPYQALMTAMSATVGTGNIAGVATAVFIGGPGALFWMWITALFGMATKFAEAVLAVKYREKDENGAYVGGPMYYIKNGMGKKWTWLGTLFAVFGAIAGFGIGNTVQSNSIAQVLEANFGFPPLVVGLVSMVAVGLVIIGGIKRIGKFAGAMVPFMALAYIASGLLIIGMEADKIGDAFVLIFSHAFTPASATGGFAGASIVMAIRFGVARGIFSNEAGLGSAPIAHASAQTSDPVRQGLVAMLGTFMDTLVICTITGLVIVISGTWTQGESGAALTSLAFDSVLPGWGSNMVAIGLAVFAFTTIIGWSIYGERCVEYLFGEKAVLPYRILWVVAVPVGAALNLDFVWLVADTLNAMMAIPNLIALAVLSPVVFALTKSYFSSEKEQASSSVQVTK